MSGLKLGAGPALRGVAAGAALISALTVVSRIAGFGRTLVLTNTVPGCVGGTYTAANTVPNIVFEVVAGGALAGLVVPLLAGGVATGDREQVRRTASALLGWTLLLLVPLAAAVALLAHPIARLFLGASVGCPGAVPLAARLLVVFAPQVVLYGVAVVLTGVLQAHRRFAGPAVAPLVSSVVVAAGYLAFAALGGGGSALGLPAPAEAALGIGTTLGVLGLALALVPPLLRLRLGLRLTLRFPSGAGPRVRRLALAGALALAGQQATAAVALRLAGDAAPAGTQLVYAAAQTVFLLPWAALVVPLATAAYPVLVGAASNGDERAYGRSLAALTRITVVAAAVAAAVLVAAAGPVAAVFFASAAASGSSAAMRGALLGFAPGLPGYALLAVLSRALYARGLWRQPSICVVGGWALAVGADLLLATVLPAGDRALALAAGHSVGVTAAGLVLALTTVRVAGPAALGGLSQAAGAGLAAAAAGAAAGLAVTAVLGGGRGAAGPGVPAAVGTGTLAAAATVAVAGTALAVTVGGPLSAAWRVLRSSGHGAAGGA